MAKRLRFKTRVSPRTRQRLSNVAAVGTLAALIGAVIFLYDFIVQTRKARAEAYEAAHQAGRNTLEGFSGRSRIQFSPTLFPNGIEATTPLLVSLRHDDLRMVASGGKVVDKQGRDLRFTYSDGGSMVPFSIERYDPGTGKLLAWIYPEHRLDAQEMAFYLYYGNDAEAAVNPEAARSAAYPLIWHFNSDFRHAGCIPLAGEYKGIKDEEGRFAGAKDFLAVEQGAAVFEPGEAMAFDGAITLSGWVNLRNVEQKPVLFTNACTTGGCKVFVDGAGKLAFEIIAANGRISSIEGHAGGTVLKPGTWYHVSASYNPQSKQLSTYINGKPDRNILCRNGYGKGSWLVLGADAGLKSNFLDGMLDEWRICKSALSPQEIARIYALELDPEAAIRLDGEEVFAAQPDLVKLEKFEAHANASHVAVHWTTSEEHHMDVFTLERSEDGKNFYKVGSQFAKGNTNSNENYMLLDPSPVYGNAYYRIRSVNFRNESQVSHLLNVHYDAPAAALYIKKVEPNPFNERFEVSYGSRISSPMAVKLTSISGKVVYESTVKPDTGKTNVFEFENDAALLPGIYFLSLSQNEEQRTVKLIKRM